MAIRQDVAVSATAQNQFTTALPVYTGESVAVSVSGTFSATATLQRSFDGGTSWRDVDSWTAAAEKTYLVDSDHEIRLGVKTGGYTSGTAVLLLRVGTGRAG